jgi:DNA-binding NarL/FixJ family response regulator
MTATPEPRTRILVVDDHPIVRLGIRQMVSGEADLEICGEADSAAAALRMIATTQPHLAVVDLSLAQGTGLDLIRDLREEVPGLRVLVLSMHDERLFADRALRAGARGYIMKEEAIAGLIRAIREVIAGRIYVSGEIAQAALERIVHEGSGPPSSLESLTDRELAVFDLVGRGLSTAAIAEQLAISVKTVETYRSNIKAKLNLRDAAELIRFATACVERL